MGTTLDKNSVCTTLESMPDRFSIDEFIDRLIVMEKIETGINQGINGDTVSERDMEKRVALWLN